MWQLVTYMFMHGSPTHLLFNMLMLWMIGVELERTWGTRFFTKFYFACGIGAGLTQVILGPVAAAIRRPVLLPVDDRSVGRDLTVCSSPTPCTSRRARS